MGAAAPLITGSARVEDMVHALAALDVLGEVDRQLLVWTVRELRQVGEVPVVVVLGGTAIATALAALTD